MTDTITIVSPLGYLQLVAQDDHVVAIEFEHLIGEVSTNEKSDQQARSNHPTLQTAIDQLQAYFDGQQRDFTFALNMVHQGTPFQQAVWQVIAEIPYGQVMSYKEIAETVGKPRAYRAVANACGANPLPIVVPCHRVVGSGANGKYTIGGYSSGLDRKRTLMALEGIEL
jgi:methylated-DNA-[protein]-cysteine S-methyltransferase